MADHIPQRVIIAGGHGRVGLILTELLIDHGDQVVSLLRNPNHSTELQALGAEPVYIDLEQAKLADLEVILEEAGAVVFAVGAGDDDVTVDSSVAMSLADAAEVAGVRRFIQIGAADVGAPVPADADEQRAAYVAGKIAAEQDLRARTELDWTILRVGSLVDEEPTGAVSLAAPTPGEAPQPGAVTVYDTATVVLELIESASTIGKTLNLVDGDTPILAAIEALDSAS